ncbi:MAG: hypothetical protein NZ898_03060 [Myxococcota bacterium]|nr:hypothetical protein [Myxococcota bacterium]MDW8361003.1 hypothetical protein [Myxococcales bacterium]
MFVRKAALRPVPRWAVVGQEAVDAVERLVTGTEPGLQRALDAGYRDLDRRQPFLAAWLAEQISTRGDELAQSVGYFLSVTVFLAFHEAFAGRLREIDREAIALAAGILQADEELRADDPAEVLDSDDVLRLGQPAVIDWVQHHVREAIAQADEETDLDALDAVYRAILVEVIALTDAVAAPAGEPLQEPA